MLKNWKKMAIKKIEPICVKNGFKFYKPYSTSTVITFIKFLEPEPDPSWVEKLDRGECSVPLHEAINIYKSNSMPEITVDLWSIIERGATVRLKTLSGTQEQWWRILNQDDLEKAFTEIGELIEKYAWDWFESKK